MSGFFSVTVLSLPEYDELVAEIYISGRFVALLSQERGVDETEIEIPKNVTLNLEVFEKALAEAKRQLFLLRKMPPKENGTNTA